MNIRESMGSPAKASLSPVSRGHDFILGLFPQYITLTLGFYSLANAWKLWHFDFLRPLAFVFALGTLLLFFLRGLRFPDKFLEEMGIPAGIVAYETGIMTFYYVAQMVSQHFHHVLGLVLWSLALVANGILMVRFLGIHLYRPFTFKHFTPPWFLMAMGICVSALTGHQMGLDLLPQWILGYGFGVFMLVVPTLLIRILVMPLSLELQPTVGIICAGPGLILTSMLAIYPEIPLWYGLSLLLMNKAFFCWLCFRMPVFFKMPFVVTLASLTFPLGISNAATHGFREVYLIEGSGMYRFFTIAGNLELLIATGVILAVITIFFREGYRQWRDSFGAFH